MDTYLTILRIIHIFSGIMWVGAGLTFTYIVAPAVRESGPAGGVFMRNVLTKTQFDKLMPTVSLLTVGAGLLLYWEISNGFDADWMGSTGGIVLSIGVLAGLGAFGHGGAVIGRTTGEMKKLGDAIQGQPTPEQATQMAALTEKLNKHSHISAALMVVAVLGMASARYM